MGRIVKYNQPCIKCSSSDAMQIYEDGGARCFSCQKSFSKEEIESHGVSTVPQYTSSKLNTAMIAGMPVKGFRDRGIMRKVVELYGVKSARKGDVVLYHAYPYGSTYKVRVVADKTFYWLGPHPKMLFGQDKFEPGGKRVVIVEGEMDTLAMQQANLTNSGKFYPVVGVPSASDLGCVLEQREWLRSFKEVVVFMDNDEAGQKALKTILRTVGYDKCKVMALTKKDVNDQLLEPDGAKTLLHAMWNAQEYVPAGIATTEQIREAIIARLNTPSHPYAACLHGVNERLQGKRGGEITLLISGTGCGKSTVVREEILNILHTTDKRIGVVSLEESIGETGRNLSAMEIRKNRKNDITVEELMEGFEKVFIKGEDGSDRLMVLDHQGAITDDTIMDQLEYMCLKGCKYLLIDHITILVSEGVDGLTGNEAQDKMMNHLLRLVKKYEDVWIGLVSHLRKTSGGIGFESGQMPQLDDIKGSGSIKQIAFDIIAFSRDTTAEDANERNTIRFSILKSRWSGDTGSAGGALFDDETGRLQPTDSFIKVNYVQAYEGTAGVP